MTGYGQSFRALGDLFRRLNDVDPAANGPDPAVEAARSRFHRRRARERRREAILPYLAEPWAAWSAETEAAAVARRFLRRFPERDLSDPSYDLLTDRQAAARYHLEEAENDERSGREFEW